MRPPRPVAPADEARRGSPALPRPQQGQHLGGGAGGRGAAVEGAHGQVQGRGARAGAAPEAPVRARAPLKQLLHGLDLGHLHRVVEGHRVIFVARVHVRARQDQQRDDLRVALECRVVQRRQTGAVGALQVGVRLDGLPHPEEVARARGAAEARPRCAQPAREDARRERGVRRGVEGLRRQQVDVAGVLVHDGVEELRPGELPGRAAGRWLTAPICGLRHKCPPEWMLRRRGHHGVLVPLVLGVGAPDDADHARGQMLERGNLHFNVHVRIEPAVQVEHGCPGEVDPVGVVLALVVGGEVLRERLRDERAEARVVPEEVAEPRLRADLLPCPVARLPPRVPPASVVRRGLVDDQRHRPPGAAGRSSNRHALSFTARGRLLRGRAPAPAWPSPPRGASGLSLARVRNA
mmetsp:Transcript_80206/g.227099  ORF Transcript_80206/g.227099 Transcript_80206/m.227099 type:complete len:407 (+) Transcript_80206:1335-2555(+)